MIVEYKCNNIECYVRNVGAVLNGLPTTYDKISWSISGRLFLMKFSIITSVAAMFGKFECKYKNRSGFFSSDKNETAKRNQGAQNIRILCSRSLTS